MPDEDTGTAIDDAPIHISAQDARGGEIILRTRTRRIIFIAGLVGAIVLGSLLSWSGYLR